MRVGVVVDNEFLNDIRVRTECDILKSGGHEVYVLHLNFSSFPSAAVYGIVRKEIHMKRKNKDFLYATMNWNPLYEKIWSDNVSDFINEYDLEIIHTHDLYMAKACRKGIENSKSPDLKLILDLHENYPYAISLYNWATKFPRNYLVQPEKWHSKEKEYLNYADRVIVLSDYFARELSEKNKINIDNFFVFPNVPDLKRFSSFEINPDVLKKDEGVMRMFYFGAVAERRGVFLLLDAMKMLAKEDNIELLIVGPVDKKDRERFFDGLTNNERVIYKDWIDISELPSYIENCDICLSPLDKNPQHESGVANKVFQYMYFAKALLISDCGPQAELVEENKCGLVHKSNDADDFLAKLKDLLSRKYDLKQMGRNAKDAIEKKYNAENYSVRLLTLYDSISQ